jgi:Cu+-exporting ATPase
MTSENSFIEKTFCYHCGDDCEDKHIAIENKNFCCDGCKMVYEILNKNNLCEYYDITANPGLNQKTKVRSGKFAFLDNETVQQKLIHFAEGVEKHVTFYLPQMHCSSCIWLIEHLPKLNPGILQSTVNFLKKEVTIVYSANKITLQHVAELLSNIGYEPHISLNDLSSSKIKKYDKARLYKIGIAGFCFGNIMMLSFPEYFSSGNLEDESLKTVFNFLNLGLSLPVFFYCASGFFISAYTSLKQKFLNIDAPIALAVLIAFGRSVYEILNGTGAGYLDSMSGIVFFMLIGRFFQDKTYQTISFDRDYKSYFPLGVTVLNEDGTEKQISVSELKKEDRIKIHSEEIIPADGILFLGKANIDYSFVTGESLATEKSIGEIIYAGGKQIGGAIELEVVKEVSQSYLTQLWNNDTFQKKTSEKKVSFVHGLSRYFTYVLFSIAILSAIYWSIYNPNKTWNAITAILIVACPCALLLSATFTNGNMLGILQKHKFYLKNANALENLSEADTIVFDKTGTISLQGESTVIFSGVELSQYQQQLIRSIANQSNHPLSKAIVSNLPLQKNLHVKNYQEIKGKGSSAIINGESIKIGSAAFVTNTKDKLQGDGSKVYIAIENEVLGCFLIKTKYRNELEHLIPALKEKYNLAVISGDNDSEASKLKSVFGDDVEMKFNQHPQDKLNFIQSLQAKGHKVVMIGDGLNDAGALQQSNAGIAISDDINNFSPGCDAILEGKSFGLLKKLFDYCNKEKEIIYGSFIISILYNIIGLFFAIQGDLSPVIAAILMPVSSASIMIYTTGMSAWYSRKLKT